MSMQRMVSGLSVWAIVSSAASLAWGQVATTTRVSVDSIGNKGSGDSELVAISSDGESVVFRSTSSNLVAGDTNSAEDIFVHDRSTGQTTRVSVDSNQAQANGFSTWPSISATGRYVAFMSAASNLVPGDTNGKRDIFVHDRSAGQTTRVSVDSAGGQSNLDSLRTSISADGRQVAFISYANNLVPGDTNGLPDAFVHDRATGLTQRVNVGSTGVQANNQTLEVAISGDGGFVVFRSSANNLVAGTIGFSWQIFVHELATGQTSIASLDSGGTLGNAASYWPSIAEGGRHVVFYSQATNLVPGDTNANSDVFVHERATGETRRVSVNSSGGQGNNWSAFPSLSPDGRWVGFQSRAGNLVPGDTNGDNDTFIHDLATGVTTRVSVSSLGVQGDSSSSYPALASGALHVAFPSEANNLVPGSGSFSSQVYVHDRLGLDCPPITTYCSASTTSLPGCQAAITAAGSPSLAAAAGFHLSSGNVPGEVVGVCRFGLNGSASTPFGSLGGLDCLLGPNERTAARPAGGTAGACDGMLDFTLQDLVDASSTALLSGTVHAQIWARDPANPDGFLLSDGLVFTVCP